ncbi:unnamed protein product [Strongylus vulgaris]|uniref:Uncharacterized protein n=1 Tax=Strongylus vulgaris TaxID=40348 RepID=A0A3P7J344_STRVU|nr:unnamed protein product [Strongylus vulgaris]
MALIEFISTLLLFPHSHETPLADLWLPSTSGRAREATQKTILLESAARPVVFEKISLSLKEPGFEACRPPSDLSGTSTANSSFTCAQLKTIENGSLVVESEGYSTPEQCVRVEIASPVLKASKSFSPSRSHHLGNSGPQHYPSAEQRVSDLKSIAEATQKIFDETKLMSRHQTMNAEKNRESLADRLSKGLIFRLIWINLLLNMDCQEFMS